MDPYRDAEAVDDAPVVVATASRVGDLGRAFVGAGVAAVLVWASVHWPLLWLGWGLRALAVGAAWDGIRHASGLLLPKRIEATDRAIRIVLPRAAPWRPWQTVTDQRIPWSEVEGIRTKELSVNGISTTDLLIETRSGTITIEPGTFAGGAEAIQRKLLDLYDRWHRQPVREALGVAAFNRRRYATTVRLTGRPRGEWLTVAILLGIFGTLAGLLSFIAVDLGPWRWVLTGAPALIGLGISSLFLVPTKYPIVELRKDGLAIGRRPDALEVIDWADVRFARRRVVSQHGIPRTVWVTVGLADGRDVTLTDIYDRPIDEIAEMIDPPPSLVAAEAAATEA